jgi:outer membrane autotransporter protein
MKSSAEFDDSNLYFTLSTDPVTGAPVVLTAQKQIARIPGYVPHEGLRKNFIPRLDTFATAQITPGALKAPVQQGTSRADKEEYARKYSAYQQARAIHAIGSSINTASSAALPSLINNLSPLGYASLVTLPAAATSASIEQLSARLEQRRYDTNLFIEDLAPQIYAIASANYADLGGDSVSGPAYNYRTIGGMVGADYRFEGSTILGVHADYANGTANFHNGGGKTTMDSASATAYFSRVFGKDGWFYADAGFSGGYVDYSVTRHTVTGTNKSSPEAWTAGGFFSMGTVLTWSKELHLTPRVGLEYNHFEIYSANETGSDSSLHVGAFSHDSLRARVGTGINWFIFSRGYDKALWKLSVDFTYAHELLDIEDTLTSRFVNIADSSSDIYSRSLIRDSIQIAPSIAWNLDEQTSIFATYRFEWGFEGEQSHNINAGVRFRF